MAACALTCAFGCSKEPEKEVIRIPEDTDVVFNVEKENGNKTVYGIGTQLDPLFLSQNVGLSGTTDQGEEWTCKESDWQLFEERIDDMQLARIRVMLRPSWFVISENNLQAGVYDYDSAEMKSLYQVLDTAQARNMDVNLTMWGVDVPYMQEYAQEWVSTPLPEYEQSFVTCFADCVKYLIEEKGYTCVNEITLFNEPNSFLAYSGNNGCELYCDLCKRLDEVFRNKGIRDRVKFNLSDDARSATWLAKTLMNLDGVIDVCNSHTYSFGDTYDEKTNTTLRDMSNEDICYNLPNFNLNLFKQYYEEYGVPHMWGEFGTKNNSGSHTTYDTYLPDRGIELARILLNFFNMGSQGASYWVLFSQYYSRSDFNTGNIMDMGLWGFADEGYVCRPMYYAYSMITRFIRKGDIIYPIESADGNVVAVAFGSGDKWSYCLVNNGDVAKKVSFVNYNQAPDRLSTFVYDESAVPTDNKVIAASGNVQADGRVISQAIAPRSFVILTNRG